jgi:hypothetical protein
MKIVCIFDDSLYAIKYTGSPENEFTKIFSAWHDTEFLYDFFEKNIRDLQNGPFGSIAIEDAVISTLNIALEMEKIFVDLSKKPIDDQNKYLDSLFEPLHKRNDVNELTKSKAKRNWLRIYALKVTPNVYIVTGGAIKLTNAMADRKHTNDELKKLESCRRYLIQHQIINPEDITEEVEF